MCDYNAVQSKKAVSPHFTSKQILPFVLAGQCTPSIDRSVETTGNYMAGFFLHSLQRPISLIHMEIFNQSIMLVFNNKAVKIRPIRQESGIESRVF